MTDETQQLALDGGPAVLPAGPPTWPLPDEEVLAALQQAYADGNWGRYHGPYTVQLIERLAEMHDLPHVTLCCSGTIAVELALRGVGIQPGDEVILAGYDFPGNFRAIETVGATPVLVDVHPDTWCLDERRLKEAVGPATKAVLVSHLHGGMAAMRTLMHFAQEQGLKVVEDACQAPGAIVEGRLAGTWGDCGVLSFGGSKLLTAGRGGAILTRHADVQQRLKIYAQRGNDAFALSELQAAVLLPQLPKLADQNAERQIAVEHLLQGTRRLQFLRPLSQRVEAAPSYYKLAWRFVPQGELGREYFVAAVQAEGVALDSGFRGFARRTPRRCRKVGALEHALTAAEQTVLLHHPVLLQPRSTVAAVAAALEKVDDALVRRLES